MRIAIFAAGEIFGGAERQILTLLSAFATQPQIAAELLVFHDRDLARRARERGVTVHVVGAGGLVDRAALADLGRVFAANRFDLVSVHGYRATTYLAFAGVARGIPVLKTEHGRAETGAGSFLDTLKSRAYRRIENFSARKLNAAHVYVTRDLQRDCAAEHRGLAQRVIYNGIEMPDRVATRRPPEYRADQANFVMVGRLERVKAVDLAIRALSEPGMPGTVHLQVVGAGPELDSLRQLASSLSVADRVTFLGFRSNVYDYIAHADALLLTSRHEGLPYTLLEALSLQTPVIATRVGGLAEVLTGSHAALLIEPENALAIAGAVRQLVEQPQVRDELVATGLQLVQERFSAATMAAGYLAAARELTASKSS